MTSKALDAEIVGLAETNADWKKVHLQDKYTYTIKSLCRQSDNFKPWTTTKTQYSTSQIPFKEGEPQLQRSANGLAGYQLQAIMMPDLADGLG